MYVVAVVTLARSVEDEAPKLAADLGVTVYEAGLALRAPSPSIVLRTEDRARVHAILGKLRERGHDAVALDAAQIVSSEKMFALRAFRFEPDALVGIAVNGVEERLPYGAIAVLVRATHSSRQTSVEKTKERQLSMGRLAMSGGTLPMKTVVKERSTTLEEREAVLYVFRNGGSPWIVRANKVRYEGLGSDLKPVAHDNFATFVSQLRGNAAPHGVYDERLLAVRGGVEPSSAGAVDLLAHLVAIAMARRDNAYRVSADPSSG